MAAKELVFDVEARARLKKGVDKLGRVRASRRASISSHRP
jgi:hypothetical protein